ncbi:MAG TPA: prepilin peptidase [Symbiobacteriaceae bacterium]|nr:prepilin peptidase [Symbiobacteriaceae bacterium]
MAELFAIYADASPGIRVGMGFLLGLVVGSFSSVLSYRLSRGESIVTPRSSCPQCWHVLGPAELVPVLSYIWLQGNCRHCGHSISWRYPALELLSGLIGLTGAYIWGAGAAIALLTALALGHALYGLFKRNEGKRKDQAGMSLVEILMAGALLAAVSASTFELIQASMRVEKNTQRQTTLLKVAREELAAKAIEADVGVPTPSNYCPAGAEYRIITQVTPNNHPGTTPPSAWDVTIQVEMPCNPSSVTYSAVLKGVVTRAP